MVSEDRQRIIETNRSLRTIKNELENLLEKGVLAESDFDAIHALLPTESSLSAPAAPARKAATASTAASPPSTAFNNLSLSNTSGAVHSPPSYASTTAAAPPALPSRNPSASAAPPAKPVLCRARALYAYAAGDARDVGFEKGDMLAVQEYMNADWWMGRNERTGAEGIFPKTYVEVEGGSGFADEKKPWAAPTQQPPQQGNYPAPPGRTNPYDSSVPPMAVADSSGGGGKGSEYGKKFGKKLGNAAVFGAGATLGGKIVNSIF